MWTEPGATKYAYDAFSGLTPECVCDALSPSPLTEPMEPQVPHLTADQTIFLAFLVPMFLGAGSFMIVRDLPAVRRLCGEA